ncbi:MAG: ABC transporter substrate-binding protein, partial [Acidobacteriia bacterium]|nr:ABC transporter substrate-binding protein [Terriglobia bacterium]
SAVYLAVLLVCFTVLAGFQQGAGTVKIGVITSLTGSQAAFGQAHKNGYLISLEELNAKGGINGKKIELDFYDDQSKPDQAVQGVNKLVDQDHVSIILGSYSSESTRAIVPVVTAKQVPLIIPTAVADNIMETGSQWIFRLCAGSGDYAKATLDFLKNNGKPKTLAIVYEATNFGQANFKSMSEQAPAAGVSVVDTEAYQASLPDYKSLLQRVKAKNPDAVYFASYLLDATTLMRQSETLNFNPKYYTSAGTGFAVADFPTDKGAGKYANYTLSVSQWLPTAKWAGSKEFDEKFFQLTKTHPSFHALEAYVALVVAANAMKTNMSSPSAIRDQVRQTDLKVTPFGPIKFDARGQNAHPTLVTQIQNQQYKVVWPPDAAEAKPIIPSPTWDQRKQKGEL